MAAHHNEWVAIVRSFGTDYPDDIVQECYIKLMKIGDPQKYFENGQINRALMWVTLRNMFYDITKKEASDTIPYDSIQNTVKTQENTEKWEALERFEDKIREEIKSWEYYDRQIFMLYRDTGYSFRKLSKEVGIGTRSIFYTIKKCKEKLNEALGEDWEDYNNNDFELI